MGGDELNLIQPGKNYGWPLVSWGSHYDGKPIPEPTTRPELQDAVVVWPPVISPSGMAFYQGDKFPKWQGKMLIGGLSGRTVVLVTTDGPKAKEHLRLPLPQRIRDIAVSPVGFIDLLTDENDGSLWRLRPLE
jgi:glucose/arabinose dehydrogenase